MAHSVDRYSTYEAKARFSEVIRRVRDGRTVTITYRGEPVAEVRPIEPASGTAARVAWLRSRGVLVEPAGGGGGMRRLARRPGALHRFLADRDE